jgi:hypothetical protein
VRLRCPSVNACVGTLRVDIAGRRVKSPGASVGSFNARTFRIALAKRNRTRLRRGARLKLTYAGTSVYSGRARTR